MVAGVISAVLAGNYPAIAGAATPLLRNFSATRSAFRGASGNPLAVSIPSPQPGDEILVAPMCTTLTVSTFNFTNSSFEQIENLLCPNRGTIALHRYTGSAGSEPTTVNIERVQNANANMAAIVFVISGVERIKGASSRLAETTGSKTQSVTTGKANSQVYFFWFHPGASPIFSVLPSGWALTSPVLPGEDTALCDPNRSPTPDFDTNNTGMEPCVNFGIASTIGAVTATISAPTNAGGGIAYEVRAA